MVYKMLSRECAVYRGFAVTCQRYGDRKDIVLLSTDDPAIATELGFAQKPEGYFATDVALQDVTSTYRERWWGELNGDRVELVAERDGSYYVSTTDPVVGEKWGLRDVERGMWWEGLVPKQAVMNVEVERRDTSAK